MKRVVAATVAALLLVGLIASAVSAQPQGTVTLTSATVNKAGQVQLNGTIVCPPYMNLGINGQVTQAIGHKVLLQSGMGGGFECAAAGLTMWGTGAQAYNGTFSAGWAAINLNFYDPSTCDQYGNCQYVAYGNFYVKLTNK